MNVSDNKSVYTDTKQHYAILDGLRGVAAILVVIFHVFESHATSRFDQIVNHGYLAVDFFFVLSGFVIGYAYNDRWGSMTLSGFAKRRLIRLHPMIIIGMVIGAVLFYFQGGEFFPLIQNTAPLEMLVITLIGMTLIPVTPAMDIRGWQEMYPLNGPAWSLFFEYAANILCALVLRKLSNRVLGILLFFAACSTIHLAIFTDKGDVIGGWSFNFEQLHIGIVRLAYPFLAGLLLSRVFTPGRIKHAFLFCSLALIGVLSFPRIGDPTTPWANGVYDAIVILLVFPGIVAIGASGSLRSQFSRKLSGFLGNISYPIYIVHYPLVYIHLEWVHCTDPEAMLAVPVAAGIVLLSLLLAYMSLKLYDIPVRRWLNQRLN
ncbi:hypothetical protein TDB9533_00725 [Thalassocella blandensis]|nr:hypothetical protein TDB9533_00725 [Thalassocella blandensis]